MLFVRRYVLFVAVVVAVAVVVVVVVVDRFYSPLSSRLTSLACNSA